MSTTEVIDLTGEGEEVIVISSNEASEAPGEVQTIAGTAGSDRSKRRRRKHKAKSVSVQPLAPTEGLEVVAAPSTKKEKRERTRTSKSKTKVRKEESNGSEGKEVVSSPRAKETVYLNSSSSKSTSPPHSPLPVSSMFMVDVKGAEVPSSRAWKDKSGSSGILVGTNPIVREVEVLLLPDHVTVAGVASAAVEQTLAETEAVLANDVLESDSFIHYQDYEDKVFRRYWEDEEGVQESGRSVVCIKCGEEGHKARECTALICEKCGIRDEHATRGCPMSKKCFTCGMTGHINKDCQYRGRMQALSCDRCGSLEHVTLECPSLWRIYTYVSERTRESTLASRLEAAELPLLGGGERYIAADMWCYNCGRDGHLGDDCEERKTMYDRGEAPSAFGTYNLQTGPFADAELTHERKRSVRSRNSTFTFELQSDPGRRGREKRMKVERERERTRLEAQNSGDDDDGWFGKGRRDGDKRARRDKEGGGHRRLADRIEGVKPNIRVDKGKREFRPRYTGGYGNR